MIIPFAVLAMLFAGCEKPAPEPEPEPEPEIPTIELTSPEDGATFNLTEVEEVSFTWNKASGINNYKINFSTKADMSEPYTVAALSNPLTFTAKELDDVANQIGIADEATATIYWNIIPFSTRQEANTQTRSFEITRKSAKPSTVGVNDETRVHKIGIYYEDMIVTSTGKTLHESCNWNNPKSQAKQLAKLMSECSHGVVDYQIVVEIDGKVPYAYYYQDKGDHKTGDVVTADMCYEEFWKTGKYPGIGEGVQYNYSKMITDNGFDTMMNEGTIDEVWVYNHPGAGMYETCMAGPNAFWINGGVFSVPSLNRKCTVLFCNYERTVDLAMHSLAHKFENVMTKVYGRCQYTVALEKNLNNWERFAGYSLVYDKYDKGCAHIGNCHYPCNATDADKHNYGYENRGYVKSYCDCWETYPYLKFENPRTINCSEWQNNQMGYMKWFYSHVPHFAGLNEDQNDYHLNNWWFYFIDYDKAKERERKLINEL